MLARSETHGSEPHFLRLYKTRKLSYVLEGLSPKYAPIFFFKREMIQGLISEPNFLLAGISHHHAVSFKSDEEHCPCSLALIRFIGYFSQELLGQHTHRLPTRIQTERKPKRFLFLCLQPTSNPGLPGSPGLARVPMPLQPSQQGFPGRMPSPGDYQVSGGQGALGPPRTLEYRIKWARGLGVRQPGCKRAPAPLPSACLGPCHTPRDLRVRCKTRKIIEPTSPGRGSQREAHKWLNTVPGTQ